MRILNIPLVFWLISALPIMARTSPAGNVVIDSPHTGDVLQGVVTIIGSDNIDGYISADIQFSYADDTTGTWFLLTTNLQPVSNSGLGNWDTTVITDGNYVLRLQVNLADGSMREFLVNGLRVRNYTPVETPTPLPIAPEATALPTTAPTMRPFPTPTGLAQNPATLTPTDVSASIIYGGMAAILTFIVMGIYLWLRRK